MAALSLPVILERCHYCSRFVSPRDILPIGTGGAKMCLRCFEWHQAALQMLAGQTAFACQECARTPEELMVSAGTCNTILRVYAKDGIYQVLCLKCGDAYERKRLDLFGDTAYGEARKLKGAK